MHPDLLELLESSRSYNVEFLIVGSTALAIHARPKASIYGFVERRRTRDAALRPWANVDYRSSSKMFGPFGKKTDR